jgi:hypothetical protein
MLVAPPFAIFERVNPHTKYRWTPLNRTARRVGAAAGHDVRRAIPHRRVITTKGMARRCDVCHETVGESANKVTLPHRLKFKMNCSILM